MPRAVRSAGAARTTGLGGRVRRVLSDATRTQVLLSVLGMVTAVVTLIAAVLTLMAGGSQPGTTVVVPSGLSVAPIAPSPSPSSTDIVPRWVEGDGPFTGETDCGPWRQSPTADATIRYRGCSRRVGKQMSVGLQVTALRDRASVIPRVDVWTCVDGPAQCNRQSKDSDNGTFFPLVEGTYGLKAGETRTYVSTDPDNGSGPHRCIGARAAIDDGGFSSSPMQLSPTLHCPDPPGWVNP